MHLTRMHAMQVCDGLGRGGGWCIIYIQTYIHVCIHTYMHRCVMGFDVVVAALYIHVYDI